MADGNVYIQFTLKNIFIHIFDTNGKNLINLWSGHLGFDGKQKKSPFAVHSIIYRLTKILKQQKILKINLFIKNTTRTNKKLFRLFFIQKIKIVEFHEIGCTVHNGCKPPRKKRR